MGDELRITNAALFSLAGAAISALGAGVIALAVYSFRQSINELRKAIGEVCAKIAALFSAHDRQSEAIRNLDRDLARLQAEHRLIMVGKCRHAVATPEPDEAA